MGFRFRRSITLAKGLRLNLGGRSASIGVGGRGLGMRFGTSGTWLRAGIPGSGISWSERVGGARRVKRHHVIGLVIVAGLLYWGFRAIFG